MIAIDPQQELFTAIKLKLEEKGYSVFDGALPPENTPYPFIYLGDMQQVDTNTKSAVIGNVFFTIHVWSNTPTNRGRVSAMLLTIKRICRSIEDTANFNWFVVNTNQRIISDTTTRTPLLHGVLEVEFKFS